MNSESVNPYQPVSIDGNVDENIIQNTEFRLSGPQLRDAEAQYLLHCHPMRLLIGSLLMIAASGAAFLWSMQYGTFAFLAMLALVMVVSTIVYSALIRRSKLRVRSRLIEHGLVEGARCEVMSDQQRLSLKTPEGQYEWQQEMVKVYRMRRGTLLCPESMLFVYVPK